MSKTFQLFPEGFCGILLAKAEPSSFPAKAIAELLWEKLPENGGRWFLGIRRNAVREATGLSKHQRETAERGFGMTHAECVLFLKALPGETISPTQLSKVTGGNPYLYNLAAKEGALSLPHMWHGRNLRIWKQPVLDLIVGYSERAA